MIWANSGLNVNLISSEGESYYRRKAQLPSRKWHLLACWILMFSLLPSDAHACPVYIHRETFVPSLPPLPRDHWRLYATATNGRHMIWQQLPLQIDPMTDKGDFVFFKGDQTSRWQSEKLTISDRISFHKDGFGARWTNRMKPPCPTKIMYEVQDPDHQERWAYLVACDPKVPALQFQNPIRFDIADSKVHGSRYAYHYLPTNQLIFTKILLNPDDPGNSVVASRNANQAIRADVKNFFNMAFDKNDVESQLLDTRGGPVSMLGRLTFFLRVLFFKIDLKLNTAVSFFRDSVHVPMVINFPIDAYKRLNPSSGIMFSWEIDRRISILTASTDDIPPIRPDLVRAGIRDLSAFGATYCRSGQCRYKLQGQIQGYSWAMNFIIPEDVVRYGFFPMLVNDTNAAQRELKWNDKPADSSDRIALYLETSGLPKGEHFYDFWITVAGPGETMVTDCPQRVFPNGAIHF